MSFNGKEDPTETKPTPEPDVLPRRRSPRPPRLSPRSTGSVLRSYGDGTVSRSSSPQTSGLLSVRTQDPSDTIHRPGSGGPTLPDRVFRPENERPLLLTLWSVSTLPIFRGNRYFVSMIRTHGPRHDFGKCNVVKIMCVIRGLSQ